LFSFFQKLLFCDDFILINHFLNYFWGLGLFCFGCVWSISSWRLINSKSVFCLICLFSIHFINWNIYFFNFIPHLQCTINLLSSQIQIQQSINFLNFFILSQNFAFKTQNSVFQLIFFQLQICFFSNKFNSNTFQMIKSTLNLLLAFFHWINEENFLFFIIKVYFVDVFFV